MPTDSKQDRSSAFAAAMDNGDESVLGPIAQAAIMRLLLGEEPIVPGENPNYIQPDPLVNQFRNREYAPGGNTKFWFGGGSPFPQTEGQQRAERAAAMGAFLSNMLGAASSTAGAFRQGGKQRNDLAALIEALKRRRQGQGGII